MFRTGLDRPPDGEALAHFAAMLDGGAGFIDVVRAVASSAEFRAVHGADEVCDATFVTRLFRNAFDRDPDEAGLAHILATGARDAALAIVAGSAEAQQTIRLLDELYPAGATPTDALGYALWVAQEEPLEEEGRIAVGRLIDAMASRPRISLLTVASMVRPDLLAETARSLAAQLYPDWELLVACPPNLPRTVRSTLERLRMEIAGIVLADTGDETGSAALWAGAFAAARGEFVAFLDAGDRRAPTALFEVAHLLAQRPDVDLLYTDEDSIDEDGTRSAPLFKSGWSPDGLLAGDVVGQLAVLRRTRVRDVGGTGDEGGALARYDLLLRATHGLGTAAIAHLPAVVFHRGRQPGRHLPFPRSRNTTSHPDVARVAARHIEASGRPVGVSDSYLGGDVWPRVRHPLPERLPRVSVLIPTRDQPRLLEACVAGLLGRTDYADLEVLIADNGSRTADALDLLRSLARDRRVRVERIEAAFNWSALNNGLARAASGDILVLMNDDVSVLAPDWLAEIVREISRPEVGIVGARLLYPDGTLQHGGMVLSALAATHVLRSAQAEQPGYLGQLVLARDLSAVTGACLAIRREVFEGVGGIDEGFDLTCNDVDLCLRARQAGWRVVWTPHAVLQHVDGGTRGHDRTPEQLARFWHDLGRLHERWGDAMDADPFLNANLRATDHDIVLASPPRRETPWAALKEAIVEERQLEEKRRERLART